MIDWSKFIEIIFKVGGLAGLASFFWLLTRDLVSFCKKPRLELTFEKTRDLRTFQFQDTGWVRKFATLHVRNKRNQTAMRCVANLQIIRRPPQVTNLEDQYALHWAGVDYTALTTGAQPIDLGAELIRLDVLFTQQGQNTSGCWIAVPFTLSGSLTNNQAYLPPGEYKVQIKITCENGKGDKARFKIISPAVWDGLDMQTL
jgi:hypothetical protein